MGAIVAISIAVAIVYGIAKVMVQRTFKRSSDNPQPLGIEAEDER